MYTREPSQRLRQLGPGDTRADIKINLQQPHIMVVILFKHELSLHHWQFVETQLFTNRDRELGSKLKLKCSQKHPVEKHDDFHVDLSQIYSLIHVTY